MAHYTFGTTFRRLYDHAVKLYSEGQRGAGTYFTADDQAWLAANGLTPQHLYDYAEDSCNYGEPTFETAVAVETIRRDYFLNVQQGVASGNMLDESSMPDKSEEMAGIAWLPRILPKVRAKLRGELPSELMYGCGGDRRFFKTHDIEPAEFLNLAWRAGEDDELFVNFVKARSAALATAEL